jgi:hypothetical protein
MECYFLWNNTGSILTGGLILIKTEPPKILLTKAPAFLDKKYSMENLLSIFFFAWNTEGPGDAGAKRGWTKPLRGGKKQ